MDYYKKTEIKVLKHLQNNPKDLCPRGMEKWEVNVTLDKLEKQGCVRVAWVEGHDAEAAEINDNGRMYLKALQYETDMETMERFEKKRKENSDRFGNRIFSRQILPGTNSEITRLQAEIKRLEQENAELKARVVELEAKSKKKYNKDEVINDLKFIFKGNQQYIEQFLDQIDGLKSPQITAVVNTYIKSKLINNTKASSKSFWEILHKHEFYDKQYQTWQSQIDWNNDGKLERKKRGK